MTTVAGLRPEFTLYGPAGFTEVLSGWRMVLIVPSLVAKKIQNAEFLVGFESFTFM